MRCDWSSALNSSGEPNWLARGPSLGSRVLVSVHSLCVVQRAAEELGTQLQAGGAFHNGRHFKQEKKKKEPLESQNNNPWTYWKSFELLLDLTEAFFEVVCGQKLVPVEGFPASERTERRSQSRESPGLLKDSQGGKEEQRSV